MSSILLKIDFKDKTHLSPDILKKITLDIMECVSDKEFFENKENIFMNYKISKKI